jgi:hypothetical protein
MKQSGRSVLLWSLGFYTVSAIVLNVVIDRWCPDVTARLVRWKWERLQELKRAGGDRPLVVMLGSSRTDQAFQAGCTERLPTLEGRPALAYNFGVPGAGAIHQYLYLREMLDRGIRPRLLLVEYLPPLLSKPHRDLISEEGWTMSAWLSASELLRVYPYFQDPSSKVSEWLLARLAPGYAHRVTLHAWARVKQQHVAEFSAVPVYPDRWGWTDHGGEFSRLRELSRNWAPSLAHYHLGKGPAQAMHDLLQCCRREGIPVVLVVTPESAEFASWYSEECQASTDRFLEELRAKYGVAIINARQWLSDDAFADGHHVHAGGAQAFTTRLSAELQGLLRAGEVGESEPGQTAQRRRGYPR